MGDRVCALGNPFGIGGTLTTGIVSTRNCYIGASPYDDFIQIDAAVNVGNSGGPAFDVEGNVVAINSSSGASVATLSDTVKIVVAQPKERRVVRHGWMGVQVQSVTADIADSVGMKSAQGIFVVEPQPDGPAVKAGILSGDVTASVNGQPVEDARDLAKQIGTMAPDSTKLVVLRQGTRRRWPGKLPNERQGRASVEDHENAGDDATRLGLILAPAAKVMDSNSEGLLSPPSIPMVKQQGRV